MENTSINDIISETILESQRTFCFKSKLTPCPYSIFKELSSTLAIMASESLKENKILKILNDYTHTE